MKVSEAIADIKTHINGAAYLNKAGTHLVVRDESRMTLTRFPVENGRVSSDKIVEHLMRGVVAPPKLPAAPPPLPTAAELAAAKTRFAKIMAKHIPVVAGALAVTTLASTAKAFAQTAIGGPTGESGIQPTHANAAGTVAHRTEMRQIQVQRGSKTFLQNYKVRVD
jgi:hypothetical protein